MELDPKASKSSKPKARRENLEPLLDHKDMDKKTAFSIEVLEPVVRKESKKTTQYVAALTATIGGFIAGNILAWSSPAGPKLMDGEYGFPVTEDDMSWVGGIMAIGAIIGCIITGLTVDVFGRKNLMLFLVAPTTIGWCAIIWAESVFILCCGRFLLGAACGSFSIVCPMYTGEIGENSIRGTLGTYFQLQIVIGILFVYLIGSILNTFWMSITCAVIPLVYAGLMGLMPESPTFHFKKGEVENAKMSLQWFRGPEYDINGEIKEMLDIIDRDEREKVPLAIAIRSKAAKKGFVIGLGIMFFQQFSGINAVIFYTTQIFQSAGSTIPPDLCTIMTGVVSVISCYIATVIVDKLGRRLLLLTSGTVMALCCGVLGGYFYMLKHSMDVSNIGWLPIACVCGFNIAFSLGFGPIPWMLVGEIFSSQIKGTASSIACLFNWACVFMVTKFFSVIAEMFGSYSTFWFFTAMLVTAIAFTFFVVPETKGKSFEQIQSELSGENESQSEASTVSAYPSKDLKY
nr:PREDICTED: facilitated trehalose transporter Tret1-2 homolog isoform X1 [Bemisia tabaci]